MAAKPKIFSFLVWILVTSLFLSAVIFLIQLLAVRHPSVQAPSAVSILSEEPLPVSPTPAAAGVYRETNISPSASGISKPKISKPVAVPPKAELQPEVEFKPSTAAPEVSSAAESGLSAGGGQGGLGAAAMGGQSAANLAINAPLTDQQIEQQIEQKNQMLEKKQELIIKRNERANEVNISAGSQSQPSGKQQMPPADSSNPSVPESIVEQIKSNRLVAH